VLSDTNKRTAYDYVHLLIKIFLFSKGIEKTRVKRWFKKNRRICGAKGFRYNSPQGVKKKTTNRGNPIKFNSPFSQETKV
jgi:hypothetical protein